MEIKKYFLKRLQSFGYAFNGIRILVKNEPNFQIHLAATIVVVIAGILIKLSVYEWVAISFSIGFVLVAEAMNTAIENLADFVSPTKNENIKRVKDLAAGAVLFSAIVAVVVGLLIFLPKFF